MLETVNGVDAKPQLVLSPKRTMAGRIGSFTMETRGQIAGMWARFAEEAGELVSKRTSYGVSYGIAGDRFQYMCGLDETDDVPADWQRLEIPEGRYLVYTYTGHILGFSTAFDAIWSKLLPEGNVAPAPRPVMEVYDERFDGRTGSGVVEIWVPIEGE